MTAFPPPGGHSRTICGAGHGIGGVDIRSIVGGYANRLTHCVVHFPPTGISFAVHANYFFFGGSWVFASSDSDLLEFIAWFLFFSSFPGGFRFEGSNENEVEIECDFK